MRLCDIDPQLLGRLREFAARHPKSRAASVVVLSEDRYGRRIDYAFGDGSPEHPRCLDWYAKPHYRAWAREWGGGGRLADEDCVTVGLNRLLPAGELYWAERSDCGGRCRVGCPPPAECRRPHWTYDEPVTCACWHLSPVAGDELAALYGREDSDTDPGEE